MKPFLFLLSKLVPLFISYPLVLLLYSQKLSLEIILLVYFCFFISMYKFSGLCVPSTQNSTWCNNHSAILEWMNEWEGTSTGLIMHSLQDSTLRTLMVKHNMKYTFYTAHTQKWHKCFRKQYSHWLFLFLFYFKKKDRRKYARCNHQIDFTIFQWVLTFTVENFVIRIYLEMVWFGFTKHSWIALWSKNFTLLTLLLEFPHIFGNTWSYQAFKFLLVRNCISLF